MQRARPNLAAACGADPAVDTEQEIEVPKISCPARPPRRAVLAATQMVEQLLEVPVESPAECALHVPEPQMGNQMVEVPVVVSQSQFQQQVVEQNVDIPVHGGVRRSSRKSPRT